VIYRERSSISFSVPKASFPSFGAPQRKLSFVVHTGYATDTFSRSGSGAPIIQKAATLDQTADPLAQSLLTAYLLASGSTHEPLTITTTDCIDSSLSTS
jgi:hypothetical protein